MRHSDTARTLPSPISQSTVSSTRAAAPVSARATRPALVLRATRSNMVFSLLLDGQPLSARDIAWGEASHPYQRRRVAKVLLSLAGAATRNIEALTALLSLLPDEWKLTVAEVQAWAERASSHPDVAAAVLLNAATAHLPRR